MATNTIELENVGPIEKLSIPIPDDGGVVVLRGRNGVGKTTALEATQSLLRGKGSLECRDGVLRGKVDGFGVKIIVGKSTRYSGELETLHLEDRLSIAELVDPGLKDANAADARRIKALVTLTGTKADLALFRDALGDETVNLVSGDAAEAADLLEMADRIRRGLHAEARRREAEAEQEKGRAAGIRESIGEVTDENDLPDEATAREAVLEAVRRQSELRERDRSSAEIEERCRESQSLLEAAEGEYHGPTTAEAKKAKDDAEAACIGAEAALAEAQKHAEVAASVFDKANQALLAAEHHERTTSGWRAAIDAAKNVQRPTKDEMTEADTAVDRAQRRQEALAESLAAKKRLSQADEHARRGVDAAKRADKLREAARATDEVLAQAIQCEDLGVVDGRLVATTGRGQTYFSDLSQGERWAIALRIAARTVGDTGLIVVPQQAWEGLDAENRALVATESKRHRVTVLTAEAQRKGESEELIASV